MNAVQALINYIKKENPTVDEVLSFVSDTINPEDLFSDENLTDWATENGFEQV